MSEAAGPSEPRAAAALALTLALTLAGLARRPAWRAHWHAPTLARTPPRALHTHALPRTRAAWPTAALARVRRAGIFPVGPPGRRRSPGGAQSPSRLSVLLNWVPGVRRSVSETLG